VTVALAASRLHAFVLLDLTLLDVELWYVHRCANTRPY
jgi:hypothetical protein